MGALTDYVDKFGLESEVAFTLGAISRRNVAARWTLKMGYKETGSFTLGAIWHDVAGCHNDASPEMSPAPILSRRSATSAQILQAGHWYRQENSQQQL